MCRSKVSGLSWGSSMLFLYCLQSSSDLTRDRLINTNTRQAISWHLTVDVVTVTWLHSSNIIQTGLGDWVVRNVWHDKNAPVCCIIPCNCRWAAKQTARPHRQQVSPGRQVRRGQKHRAHNAERRETSHSRHAGLQQCGVNLEQSDSEVHLCSQFCLAMTMSPYFH